MIKIIIAGSRNFNDYNFLKNESLKIIKHLKYEGYNTKKENIEIISGTANGADKLGEKFAKEFELCLKQFPANWNLYGNSAGYRRNREMALYAKQDSELNILIAYWDGISKGTKHMINLADNYKLKTFIVNYNNNKIKR